METRRRKQNVECPQCGRGFSWAEWTVMGAVHLILCEEERKRPLPSSDRSEDVDIMRVVEDCADGEE